MASNGRLGCRCVEGIRQERTAEAAGGGTRWKWGTGKCEKMDGIESIRMRVCLYFLRPLTKSNCGVPFLCGVGKS